MANDYEDQEDPSSEGENTGDFWDEEDKHSDDCDYEEDILMAMKIRKMTTIDT